jgi:glycosyltransferase involved in cell wall biosynthesis
MKVYYWSPHLSKVATVKSVINSSIIMRNNGFNTKIINAVGEWNDYDKNEIININNSSKFYDLLPKKGFLKSRLSYFLIFSSCFIPLLKLLKKDKPDYLVIHLITSLPLILNLLFNLNIKIILRISGKPHMNLLRYFFWKIALKKIFCVTTPTSETLIDLKKLNIIDINKIFLLTDPILENINCHYKNIYKKKHFLCVGRLSKQKNFLFILKCFKFLINKYLDINLKIVGSGEELKNLENYIYKNKMNTYVELIPYNENIEKYYKESDCFILGSLWEDPGFVIVEAANYDLPVISSDCPSGPKEILENGVGGFLFKSNNVNDFLKKFDEFMETDSKYIRNKNVAIRKNIEKYTFFNHYKLFVNILKF